jgi:hypothetical protein
MPWRVAGAFVITAGYLIAAAVLGGRWVDEDRCRHVGRPMGISDGYVQRSIWRFPPHLRCEFGGGEVIIDYSLTLLLVLIGVSALAVMTIAFGVLGRVGVAKADE